MSSIEEDPVSHNVQEQRFEATVEGLRCVAEYQREGSSIVFTHTYVPPALRGRGIAERLVRAALEFAREQQLRVVPACSYVAVFLQRHKEFSDLAR